MLFGVCNAPTTFERLMKTVTLRDLPNISSGTIIRQTPKECVSYLEIEGSQFEFELKFEVKYLGYGLHNRP